MANSCFCGIITEFGIFSTRPIQKDRVSREFNHEKIRQVHRKHLLVLTCRVFVAVLPSLLFRYKAIPTLIMKVLNSCKWLKCLSLLFFIGISCFPLTAAANNEDARGVLDSLKETYDELPDAGKFATGAVAGFGATRFTVNKVVTVVKLGGAIFIGYVVLLFVDVISVDKKPGLTLIRATCTYSSEALKASGALERVSEENMDMAQKVKASVVNTLDKYREGVRKRLHPESLRQNFKDALDKDRMAALGFASGCFVGCVL